MMNQKGEALLASALLAVGAAGCSPEQVDSPSEIPFTASTPSETVAVTPQPEATVNQSNTVELLAADAPIRLIFVPVVGKLKPAIPPSPDEIELKQRLLSSDPDVFTDISTEFKTATNDRYIPSKITLVKAGALSINSCLNSEDSRQISKIQHHTRISRDDEALNILVVDQVSCDHTAGYAHSSMDPIITIDALPEIANTIVHEVGHRGDLDHAATADCADIDTIKNCKISPEADENSIMSYKKAKDSDDFTAPELLKLGLLDKDEIIDEPDTGVYKLVDINAKGPKVLSIQNRDKTLYFSWEKNINAKADQMCKEQKSHKERENPTITNVGEVPIGKTLVTAICYSVNKTGLGHELQTRYDDAEARELIAFPVVLRPDRAPDKYEGFLAGTGRDTGETRPGTVLFSNDSLEVSLTAHQGDAQATVKVTRK